MRCCRTPIPEQGNQILGVCTRAVGPGSAPCHRQNPVTERPPAVHYTDNKAVEIVSRRKSGAGALHGCRPPRGDHRLARPRTSGTDQSAVVRWRNSHSSTKATPAAATDAARPERQTTRLAARPGARLLRSGHVQPGIKQGRRAPGRCHR